MKLAGVADGGGELGQRLRVDLELARHVLHQTIEVRPHALPVGGGLDVFGGRQDAPDPGRRVPAIGLVDVDDVSRDRVGIRVGDDLDDLGRPPEERPDPQVRL